MLLNKTDREGRKKNQDDKTYHVITCHTVRTFNLMSEKKKKTPTDVLRLAVLSHPGIFNIYSYFITLRGALLFHFF